MQVFLDTYADEGIRKDLAQEALAYYSPEAFRKRLSDDRYAAQGYRDIGSTQHAIDGQSYENRVLVKALDPRPPSGISS